MLSILMICLLANFMLASSEKCSIGEVKFENFDMTKYVGVWNELYRIPNIFEKYYSCEYDNYTRISNDILATSRAYNTSTQSYETSHGEVPTWTTNSFTIKYVDDVLWTQKYWVLGTDYTTYSIVAGCLDGEERLLTWIASRSSSFNDDTLGKIKQILAQYKMTLQQFESVVQTNCPPHPELTSN